MRRQVVFTVLVSGALILAGCAAGVGTSPKGLELPIERAAIKLARQVAQGGYRVISAEDLAERRAAGEAMTVIDTMPPAAFKERRIAGAVNSPAPKSEAEVTPAVVDGLLAAAGADKGRRVVVYCGFVACGRSHVGAKILVDQGYTEVFRMPAGIVGWAEGGFPLDE